MASLYHPTAVKPVPKGAVVRTVRGVPCACWTNRKGRAVVAPLNAAGRCTVESPTWWVEYRSHSGPGDGGTVLRVPGFRDKAATQQLAARLERAAEARRAGKLAPEADAGVAHLADHLPAYREHQRSRGNTDKHAGECAARVGEALAGCGLTSPAAVDPEKVMRWLDGERRRNGWATRTVNHRVKKLRAFGAWLVATGRAAANPFARLATGNAERDRRHVRRALTPGEAFRVVAAALASSDVVAGMSGTDRAMLYLVAAYTGLRLRALARLTPESFRLDVPAVHGTAGTQKNLRPVTVPLRPDVAALLAPWLSGKDPGRPVWAGWRTWTDRAPVMLRHDLAACDPPIPYADAAGRVADFHALRVTFGTMCALAGVPLAVAQGWLAHSDPKLTAVVYTQAGVHEQAAEAAKLPRLGSGLGSWLGSPVQN